MYDEIMWRITYFWYIFKPWLYDVVTVRPPHDARGFTRIIEWKVDFDGKKEHCYGTFSQFLKWLVTHEKVF